MNLSIEYDCSMQTGRESGLCIGSSINPLLVHLQSDTSGKLSLNGTLELTELNVTYFECDIEGGNKSETPLMQWRWEAIKSPKSKRSLSHVLDTFAFSARILGTEETYVFHCSCSALLEMAFKERRLPRSCAIKPTDEEMEVVQDAFSVMDVDGSGSISFLELNQIVKLLQGGHSTGMDACEPTFVSYHSLKLVCPN